jgi:hypothetical protein
MRNACLLAIAAAICVPVLVARADIVPLPPTDCAPGFTGSTCHAGAYCRPATCPSTGACAAGSTCRDIVVCIRSFDCGGMRPYGIDATYPLADGYSSECPSSGTCSNGKPCSSLRVCMPTSATTTQTATQTTSITATATTTTTVTTDTTTATATLATDTNTDTKPGLVKSSGCSCSLSRGGLSVAWLLLVLSGVLALRARRGRR